MYGIQPTVWWCNGLMCCVALTDNRKPVRDTSVARPSDFSLEIKFG